MFRGGKQEAMTDEAGVTEEGNSQLWADVGVIGGDSELDNSEVSVNQWTAVIAEKGSTLSQSCKAGDVNTTRDILTTCQKEYPYNVYYYIVNHYQNVNAFTPLHYACYGGHEFVAKMLLWSGANPYMLNVMMESCFDSARAGGHFFIACRLEEYFMSLCHLRMSNAAAPSGTAAVAASSSSSSSSSVSSTPVEASPSPSPENFDWLLRVVSVNGSSESSIVGQEFSLLAKLQQRDKDKSINELVIGRSSDCDINIGDLSLSKRHAAIRRVPAHGYCVEDLGSKHGTYLDSKKLMPVNENTRDGKGYYLDVNTTVTFGLVECRIISR
jgi:hypothetical protein